MKWLVNPTQPLSLTQTHQEISQLWLKGSVTRLNKWIELRLTSFIIIFWRDSNTTCKHKLTPIALYNMKLDQGDVVCTCDLHWFHGQYPWSMWIGVSTFLMIRFSKWISEAEPRYESGHVLILTPVCVFVRVQPITLTPDTGCSFGYLPRLPMLIPWPGPQFTPWISISRLPSPREMQSSPVEIFELITLILVERPMWIPSVFGLFLGALMVTWLNVRFWHPKTLMWNCLLLYDVMSRTIELVTKSNLRLCWYMKA